MATFLLTVTNPMTILSFTSVVAGVFTGSLLWWFLLSGGVVLAHRRLPEGFSRWVSWFSGGILTAFGLGALISLMW